MTTLPELTMDDDDGVDAVQQEAELNRLAKQLRMLDQERKLFSENAERLKKRQKLVLKSLEYEKHDLDTILRVSKADTQIKIDSQNKQTLVGLRDALDYFNEKADVEAKKLKHLESEIEEAEKTLVEQKRIIAKRDPFGNDILCKNRIRLLENILNNWNRRVNHQLAVNTSFREELNILRAEKALNHKLFKQCEERLQNLHRELSMVIRRSLRCYEKRDENMIKIAVLKERDRKDQEMHMLEMRELYRMIDHDQRLKEFMVAKANERLEVREEEKMKRKKLEKILSRKDDEQKAEIDMYENAIAEVKRMSGENDLDKIIVDIQKQEDENFALFNFINKLDEEVETLLETVKTKKTEIGLLEVAENEHETKRKTQIRKMTEEQEKMEQEILRNNRRTEDLNDIIDKLRSGVSSLFDTLECDRSIIDCMLGMPETLSENHILMFMGLIEQRTNELLQLQQYIELKRAQADGEMLDMAPKLRRFSRYVVGANYNVIIPNIWDEEDHQQADIYYQRPMTREEIKAAVLKKLANPSSAQQGRRKSST